MFHVKKNVRRISKELLAQVKTLSTATVHEVMNKRGALIGEIKPLAKGVRLCGEALTVKLHPADNLMLIKAISMLEENQVLVIDSSDTLNAGPFGEVLAVECLSKKCAGLVTDGSVRDSEQIIKRGFPVFSAGISIRGTSKAAVGTVNHPISCGGILVNPGDIILGDDDGVVVIPFAEVEEVIQKSLAREEDEAKTMEKLQNGASLFDLYGYQATFDALKIKVED